jgi:hypothetical protein
MNCISKAFTDDKSGMLTTNASLFPCLDLDANVWHAWDRILMGLGWLIGGIRGRFRRKVIRYAGTPRILSWNGDSPQDRTLSEICVVNVLPRCFGLIQTPTTTTTCVLGEIDLLRQGGVLNHGIESYQGSILVKMWWIVNMERWNLSILDEDF